MESYTKLSIFKKGLLFALVAISVYALKIPIGIDFPLYRIVYLILFIKLSHSYFYKGSIIHTTNRSWTILILWSVLLAVISGFSTTHLMAITWALSIPMASSVISNYFINLEKRYWIYYSFIIITGFLALTGCYEAITGRYYHETINSYSYIKNIYGYYRPNTIFYNVNDNAIFMSFCFVIASFFKSEKKKDAILKYTSMFLYAFNIVMVDSRGAVLSIVVFIALSQLFTRIKKKWVLVLFCILLGVISFATSILSTDFFEMEGRLVIWKHSLHSLEESSYLGVGPGMISAINESAGGDVDVYAVHNFFLEIFCDTGIVGLLAVLIWYLKLMTKTFKLSNVEGNHKLFSAVLVFLTASITCSSLIGKVFAITFFAFLIAEINRAEYYNNLNQ